jgi:hypothetical protein
MTHLPGQNVTEMALPLGEQFRREVVHGDGCGRTFAARFVFQTMHGLLLDVPQFENIQRLDTGIE